MMSSPENAEPLFRYRFLVDFADTDLAGIVHFANFFRYMERAEHAFWRSLGLSVHMEKDGRTMSWPRVQASCDYKMPLRFEDEVEVEVSLRELRPKAILFNFVFRKVATSEVAAEGTITAVCAAWDEDAGRMRAVAVPDSIRDRIIAAGN